MHVILKQILIKSTSIVTPDDNDFELIKQFITQFELDNRVLQRNQFLAAKENGELFGFGRIRTHAGCAELCSLGVTEPKRMQGIGKQLVEQLILKAHQPLYLVCIIPEFFIPFGFQVVSEYPEAMADKLHYCTSELIVPEKYVVMKYTPDDV